MELASYHFMVLRILRCLLDIWKICAALSYVYFILHFDVVTSELFITTNPTHYLHLPARMVRIDRNTHR
jgi:hypothetical protein